jgi:hypothetical protein
MAVNILARTLDDKRVSNMASPSITYCDNYITIRDRLSSLNYACIISPVIGSCLPISFRLHDTQVQKVSLDGKVLEPGDNQRVTYYNFPEEG